MLGVRAGDLADADVLAGDVELLVVGLEQLLRALAVGHAGGEQLLPQLLQRDLREAGEALGHGDIPLGAGGGLEHDRVGEDGPGHQPRDLGRRHDAVLLVHGGDDGIGAADGFVADADGLPGLDIGQPVVVDDLEDLHLLQPGDGLGGLVVVDQDDLLAPRFEQVEAGDGAHHLLVLIEHGIAAETALEHDLLRVVEIVAQMEGEDVAALADARHGQGLVDQPGDPPGGQGRGDDHGAVAARPFRLDLRAAEDQAVDTAGDGLLDDLGLVAHDQDAVRIGQRLVLVVERQGDVYLAGDAVPLQAEIVDERALQHAQQIEDRHVVHAVLVQGLQVEGGDVARREHAEQAAALVHDGHYVDRAAAHRQPGQMDGDGVVQRGRGIVFQIPDLGAHVLDQGRRLHPEVIQQALGLVVDGADSHGLIVPVAQRIAKLGVCHGGDDGVRIGVAVPGNVNVAHKFLLCSRFLTRMNKSYQLL